MKTISWVIVMCGSRRQAKAIGDYVLHQRFVACYDIVPRLTSAYFWPPKSGRIEQAKGVVLLLETLPTKVPAVRRVVRKLHSDKLPFIGHLPLQVEADFFSWISQEVKR